MCASLHLKLTFHERQMCTGAASETEQAVGRLVGALCAVTARDEDAQSAMLASWISQVEICNLAQHDKKRCTLVRLMLGG